MISCHARETHAIYKEWGASKHFRANVGCYECHQTKKTDADLFDHEGFNISIIVSPKDCTRCHPKEVGEFDDGRHSKAGLILGSLDNFLADIVEGDKNFYGGSGPHGHRLQPVSRRGDGGQQGRHPQTDELAQIGHGPHQPRLQQRRLHRLPPAPRLFRRPGPATLSRRGKAKTTPPGPTS